MTTNQIDFNSFEMAMPEWPCVYDGPSCTGRIKCKTADFCVDEQLSFVPSTKGEHVFLLIEKCGENTEYVARSLARYAGVRQCDIGYAGLKDRHAKTTQWFSVWLPGKQDPDWEQFETENIKIQQSIRHVRKLKHGSISANQFKIVVRDLKGDYFKLDEQLRRIKAQGFPNYFGSQRFGHNGQNIKMAMTMFKNRKIKRQQRGGIYLSASRSYLFNQVLAARVLAANWNQAVAGDCFMFDHSNSYFQSVKLNAEIIQRVEKGEIHPTGLLFGKGEFETVNAALQYEQRVIDNNLEMTEGLLKFRVEANRRALRVFAEQLQWSIEPDSVLTLNFSLPSGSYATSLLKEVINYPK